MSRILLLYYSQLKICYLLYNIIELVERNGLWYCFAMKPPVVKAKMGKKVVSAMYVAIRRKI